VEFGDEKQPFAASCWQSATGNELSAKS